MFIPKLYNDQLLYGFYLKRGKALVIPQILYSIHRYITLFPKKKVRILDIGCNDGRLLEILQHIAQTNGFADKIELFGLDKNDTSIEQAKQIPNLSATYYSANLCSPSTLPKNTFDIIIAINTLHEVFSEYLVQENLEKAKLYTEKVYSYIISMLSATGCLVVYDGLAVSETSNKHHVMFKFRTPEAKKKMLKIVEGYKLFEMNCQELGKGVYSMSGSDLLRSLALMKYVDTPLWEIESKQSYQYFSYEEFVSLFEKEKCVVETVAQLNGDRGLWMNYVEILSKSTEFPPKSIIITATKGYIPPLAKFDSSHVLEFV